MKKSTKAIIAGSVIGASLTLGCALGRLIRKDAPIRSSSQMKRLKESKNRQEDAIRVLTMLRRRKKRIVSILT